MAKVREELFEEDAESESVEARLADQAVKRAIWE